jgi:hypothetical protein
MRAAAGADERDDDAVVVIDGDEIGSGKSPICSGRLPSEDGGITCVMFTRHPNPNAGPVAVCCRIRAPVFRNGDVADAHGVVPAGVATLLGRLPRRCGASRSEVDRRGVLRRACAHFNASPQR